ncbi:sensor histidine kinase [Gilvimarinus sp. DA14]|uniref:sensor histidine kinase n=1 Tax=Gilvimarinus sp. DA14 TaxID=2956798 RepID=UPI0020B7D49D|nr:histidine kinase [Gilvimarinus sp. DA14]UTF59921.1 histidine kinase [Gilvimarinus sp. DA14]
MNSIFYPVYQALGWLALYIGLTFVVSLKAFFTPFEYLYGAVLIGAAACYSHLIRLGFKRWLYHTAIYWQLLYLFCQSVVGGCFAGLVLMLCVFGLSAAGITDPIAPGQQWLVFKMVFWGNAANMITALVLWSAIYLTIIKTRQLREMNQALASSQLDVLIQQLSPHFLFNVLNNIRAMILHDPSKSREALAQLADMLRYNLQRDNSSKVSLAEELEIVREYIALCQLHYEDRLIFNPEVELAARECLIPRMLLQLVVENAIKHGISKLAGGGEILLQIKKEDETLLITIQNPCPHYSDKAIETKPGIGLHNVERRLALMYPAKVAQLEYQRTSGEDHDCVRVMVSLPAESASCA